jgi:hydrogenase nickel incorporation protein HypA/HybF
MHEMSIAEALRDLTARTAPVGSVVLAVRVRVGPMRGIDPDAMNFAWRAATGGGFLRLARLELEMLPWHLQCAACGRKWTSDDPTEDCSCGCELAHPVGGNELLLMSLDVQDSPAPPAPALTPTPQG